MPLIVGEVAALLTLDDRPFNKGMDRAGKRFGGLTKAGQTAKLALDSGSFESGLNKADGKLGRLARVGHDVKLGLDTGAFKSGVDKAGSKLGQLGDVAKKVGTAVGDDLKAGASAGLRGLSDVGKKAGAAVGAGMKVGAAAALLAVSKGFADALNIEAANDKLAAQLGATGDYAANLGEIAGNLYANAYGESIGQVNEALKGVMQNGVFPEDATTAQIESVTAKVLDLATAFDQDLGATSAAVGQMIRTGLAKDADEALDIITRGFQQGADKAGDLLDTWTEYSTMFRDVGIDGATATGLLSQGLRAGARDADTVADALKEFAIRGQDASESAAAGYKAIGLSAEDMTAKVAGGGEGASEALDMVLDSLRGVEDPVKRNAAAVALFGTKAEDLGDSLYSLDPSTAVKSLGLVEGAAGRMGATLADNATTKIEAFKRQGLQRLSDFVGGTVIPAMERLAPVVQAGVDWLVTNGAPVVQRFSTMAREAMAAVADWVRDNWPQIRAAVASVTDWLVNEALPVAQRFAAMAREAMAMVVAWVRDHWPQIRSVIEAVVKWLTGTAAPFIAQVARTIADAFARLVQWVRDNWGQIRATIETTINVIRGIVEVAVRVIQELWSRFGATLIGLVQSAWTFVSSIIHAALNIIMGVVRTVMAVIHGDWGKAWEGIKQLFAGVWEAISAVVRFQIDRLKLMLSAAWEAVKIVARLAWEAIKFVITRAWDGIKTAVGGAVGWVAQRLSDAWNGIKSVISAVWNGITGVIRGAWDGIKSLVSDAVGSVARTLSGAWNGIKRAASSVWDAVGDAIRSGINIGISAINFLIRALNKVADILPGVNFHISEIAKLASGGAVTPTGRREAAASSMRRAYAGGGTVGGIGEADTVPALLTPGEFVVRKAAVRRIGVDALNRINRSIGPARDGRDGHYALGGFIPSPGDLVDGLKGAAGQLRKGMAMAAFAGPNKIADGMIDRIPWDLVRGGVRGIKDAAYNWVKGTNDVADRVKMEDDAVKVAKLIQAKVAGESGLRTATTSGLAASGPPNGSYPGGAGAAAAKGWITQALNILGLPAGQWLPGLMRRANQESGYNPRAQNNWDSNAKKGIPSKGFLQTIDPTFQAYKYPGYNDIWNPVDNTLAAIRYMQARYGSVNNLPVGGYARGGIVGHPSSEAVPGYRQGGGIIHGDLLRAAGHNVAAQAHQGRYRLTPNRSYGFGGTAPIQAALARGGVITRPTVAALGEEPGARTEIVTPEDLMRRIVREETGAGRGPAVLVEHAEFHDDADLEAFDRKIDFAVTAWGR